MLVSVYPGIKWDVFKCRSTIPHHFWDSLENQPKYLDKIAHKFKIKTQKDCKQINHNQIKDFNVIGLITNKYNGSIFSMLVSVYPEIKWLGTVTKLRNRIIDTTLETVLVIRDFLNQPDYTYTDLIMAVNDYLNNNNK